MFAPNPMTIERSALVQKLEASRVLPFLRKDFSPQQVELAVDTCAKNGFKVLGFMHERMSEGSVEFLKSAQRVRSGEVTLAATSISSPESLYQLQDTGIRILCFGGDISDIDTRRIDSDSLFVPIVNDVLKIEETLFVLKRANLPPFVKTFVRGGSPLQPEEISALSSLHPEMQHIVFGGIRPDNIRDYLQSGALAFGMGKLLPDNLLDNSDALARHVGDIRQLRDSALS